MTTLIAEGRCCAFKGKIHAYFAIMLWVLFAANNTWLNPFFMIFGSLFPDADIKFSPMGKIIPLWAIKGVKHRGITHTLQALLCMVGLVFIFMGFKTALAYGIGHFSHLFLDSCTPSGINWWGRKKKRRA